MFCAKSVLLILSMSYAVALPLLPLKSNKPPVVYLVTQHDERGNLIMTDTAILFSLSNEGRCVSYVRPDDPSNADDRIVCGGLIRVRPKPKKR